MKIRTLGILLILALTLIGNADAAESAPVKQNTIVWQGIVSVPATFTVAKGETLEIRPGSKILFSQGSGLVIKGTINAVGLKGKEIVFAAAKGRAPSHWNEITFEAADSSRLEFCVFESATWGVHSHDTNLSITNCTFRHNEGGLRFHGGPLTLQKSRFTGNGIGLRSHQGEGKVEECEFSDNVTGIFVREKGSGLKVNRSNFVRNSSYNMRLGDFNDEDVQAPGNWWGEDGPAGTIFDDRIESGIGRVNFEPYSRVSISL